MLSLQALLVTFLAVMMPVRLSSGTETPIQLLLYPSVEILIKCSLCVLKPELVDSYIQSLSLAYLINYSV